MSEGKKESACGAQTQPTFAVEALRKAAGGKAFEKGEDYYEDGVVRILTVEPQRVVAKVSGSELYHCELSVRGGAVSGHCSCPAYSDWGFCKHLVATGLAANALQSDDPAVDRLAIIRAHLLRQSVEALTAIVMQQVERDASLLASLDLAAAASEGDSTKLLARLDEALTEAVDTEGIGSYRGAGDWAEDILRVFAHLEGLIGQGQAALVQELLDRFFDRMEEAIEQVDDSDGDVGEVLAKAEEIHLAACRAARSDPIQLARTLFDREMETEWSYFDDLYHTYGKVLGKRGRVEYRRLAEEAWAKLEVRHASSGSYDAAGLRRRRLASILEVFAQEDGDFDARIAIRAKDLSSPYAYQQLAELCLQHGREQEALKWAEEGLWQFDGRPDERLATFAAELYAKLGRKTDAEALLWQVFDRQPRLELYARLKTLAGRDADAVASVTQRAVERLKAGLASGQRLAPWGGPADLIVELLQSEGRFADAWAVLREHGLNRCSDRALEALANASDGSHHVEAMDAYAALVERNVRGTTQQGYEAACRLIERLRTVRERHGESAVHAAYLADVMSRHKAKRNFMKLLAERKPRGSGKAS
jgi:uncharacterized Zn finger protein